LRSTIFAVSIWLYSDGMHHRPATLASRLRVLSSGRSTNNDANDARSVAVAALPTRGFAP
jgi:hypothetical protein